MASPHRLRTTDIADFFRAGHSSRATDSDEPGPSSPTFLAEPESPVKRKRSSRIPFLGRQRKKSTQSDASAASTSSAGPSSHPSDSDVRDSSASRKAEPRPAVPPIPSLDDGPERPLPALPTPSPINSSSPSLGSKLAARFAPSRQKLLNLSPRKQPSQPPPNEPILTLSPPTTSSRATSIDSTSSGHHDRSVTPRPNHPTITVSLPPDNLDGYEGMFTLPISSESVDDPQLTPTSATSNIPYVSPPPSPKQILLRRASRISRRHVGTAFKHNEVDSTDAEDSEAIMSDSPKPSPAMNVGPTPIAEKRRTLATMPYNYSEKASPRSIMKPPSDRHRPAFPPPPPSNPPSSALPVIPSSITARKSNGSSPLLSSVSPRQRAQTLSTVPSTPISSPTSSLSTLPSRRITKSISEGNASASTVPRTPASILAKQVTEEASGKENFDMEKASADQLRQALTLRNQQFDELASYLLKITEAHVAEKHALLKKVASLEQEAARRENEIKGLTWLVKNNTRPGSSGSTKLSDTSKSTSAEQVAEPSEGKLSSSSFSPSNLAEDSGAESHQTTSGAEESYRDSGPESMWGSGTSGGESSSSSPVRKVKRNNTLMSSFYRTPIKNARGETASVIPTGLSYRPSPSSSPSTKRSSISSFGTTSPSSSTSSLSLSAVTPATTVTSLNSLSAIPEAAAPLTRTQDPVVAAAILATEHQREKEEQRRAKRDSDRLSASSVTAPPASAAYSANLKRARPPSIAQVLAQSPKMEHGRVKLRSTNGSASS
ncbi:hypothetical protein B0H13DRAFT_2543286 [Mycena leptocephala]|nr:hypothetical protein B0H13DRAFT_2543286 [Mycena leptocephala]